MSENKRLRIKAYGLTDVGRKRKSNQDAILLARNKGYFVLADGMGGHRGGEEASRIATKVVGKILDRPGAAKVELDKTDRKSLEGLDGSERLTRMAILEADRQIVETSLERKELKGMGSTVETLIIKNGAATIGHVGDSRVYLARDGQMELVTDDHSLLNEELKRHDMSDSEIANFPFKHRIVRALGHLRDRVIDIHHGEVSSGDLFLMCSDGLTDVASDADIQKILLNNREDLEKTCRILVDFANERGGPDNISVIVAQVE